MDYVIERSTHIRLGLIVVDWGLMKRALTGPRGHHLLERVLELVIYCRSDCYDIGTLDTIPFQTHKVHVTDSIIHANKRQFGTKENCDIHNLNIVEYLVFVGLTQRHLGTRSNWDIHFPCRICFRNIEIIVINIIGCCCSWFSWAIE